MYTNSFQFMRFDKFLNYWSWFINSKIMTLLHFDLRKFVRRTGFRTHFLQNLKLFKISNKIYTNSFQFMRFDKYLNYWSWFLNSKIMTLLHFDLRKFVGRTGFRTHFLQNSKNFEISNKIYRKSFILMKFDDSFLNSWNWFINIRIMTLFQFNPWKPVQHTSFRALFLQNSKFFQKGIKTYTESFQMKRYDDRLLNCWNWFINNRIMTVLHFDPRKPVRCTGFRTHFLQFSKNF